MDQLRPSFTFHKMSISHSLSSKEILGNSRTNFGELLGLIRIIAQLLGQIGRYEAMEILSK